MRGVSIVGIGHSKFGRRDDASLRELAFESVKEALEDAEMSTHDIEATVIGVANQFLTNQTQSGAIVTDYIGMNTKPSFTTVAACASGSAAIRAAWTAIASGLHDTVLVCGVEKMTEVSTSRVVEILGFAGDPKWEFRPTGITNPGTYAMFACAHMHKYGTTEKQLALVAVKNHKYGAINPVAHLRREVTVEDALKSRMIAYPLKLYDCSLISDGAAAVILASDEKAKKVTDTPISIAGLGCATDTAAMHDRADLTSLRSAVEASKQAYKMAGVSPEDIDVACVHDCFTIAEIMAYEDLGFCEKGKGGNFIEEEQSHIGGKTPTNVDGGLKSKGHPLGATGVSMAVEITKQLRGECGPRQVPGAEIGLSHNVAMHGTHCMVHIYRR